LNRDYWREEEGYHVFGILRSGGTNDNLTVWPATAAAFGLLEVPRAKKTLTALAADAISSDWGAHILSTASPLYDPLHYNNGAVWPFVTGFVAWGQYRYQRPWAGFPLLDALKQMIFQWSRGRHPELLSGAYYRPLDTAVPQQFFATSMLVTAFMRGLLGWEPDAPSGRVRMAPQIPPSWKQVVIRNVSLGETRLNVELEQDSARFTAEVVGRGPDVTLELALPIPPGAGDVRVSSSSKEEGGTVAVIPVTSSPVRIEAGWSGGLAVEPPTVNLVPGRASRGLRILDFRYDDNEWILSLEGVSGETYRLQIYGEPVTQIEGARLMERREGSSTIEVSFPPGRDRKKTVVHLRR
jgi:hypothetical protein